MSLGLGAVVRELTDAPQKTRRRGADHKPATQDKIDWEVPRKVLHSSIGFLVLPLYISHSSVHVVIVYLSVAFAVIGITDIIRLRYPSVARTYERFLGFLMRDSEKNSTNGVIWYLLGAIIVLSLYPLDIAVVSILILSWCDTAASTFGRMYGRRTSPLPQSLSIPLGFAALTLPLPFARRKSVAGFLGGAVTGSLIAVSFWGWVAPMGEAVPAWSWSSAEWVGSAAGLGIVSVVTGVVAGVSEALDVGNLDDNLTLPVIAGGAMWGFFKLLDWLTTSPISS
ncbi:hypothetical protein BD410DRAFT_733364 [Rickenella mellea]|uniref:Phosphatidate cytidylyltransferase n=1 Tax=Rickenella mellea TaxID=50990 RepID=A0A4Y7PIU7_9AGAM|nr:hypothetical protein BD410DRAFT_733364 [Rickenella mellea]